MTPAPFFADIADGPDGGAAWWLTTEDGVRIRVCVWAREAMQGTVLLFPGRTEYVEKYGRTAAEIAERGYATLTIDWRGQGLADRFLADPRIGHIRHFQDYQHDVRAAIAAARALALPRPYHLIAHSMGGCIGLRALIEGLDVETVAFSAPMWGIVIAPVLRPFARLMTSAARPIGLGHRVSPGAEAETYVLAIAFEDNKLTRDQEMFDYMHDQVVVHPELALGGPSIAWVNESLREVRELRAMPSPSLPAYCAIGSRERIVDVPPVMERMARWPGSAIETYEGAEHEVLMEAAAVRGRFLDTAARMFQTGAAPAPASAAAAG